MIKEREIQVIQPGARAKTITVLEVIGPCLVQPPLTLARLPISDTQEITFLARIPEEKPC